MRVLADAGADPLTASSDGSTALVAAAMGSRRIRQPREIAERQTLKVMSLALELGAPINAHNNLGETALHVVAARRLNTVVGYLAKEGAALNVKDRTGRTPLTLASLDYSGLTVVQTSGLRHRPTRSDESTAELLLALGAEK